MQEQSSPERTGQAEPFSDTLRRCFDKYKNFACDPDTVAAFRLEHETNTESRIVDISVFPYQRGFFHKDVIKHVPLDGDRHPARLLTEFTSSTETVADVFAIADILTSDDFRELCASSDFFLNARSRKSIIEGTHKRVYERAAALVARTEDGADAFVAELSARLQDEESARRIVPLMPGFESVLRKQLIGESDQDAPTPEEVARIAKVAWMMEDEGLLMDETATQSIFSSHRVLIHQEFAELLTARLRERPASDNRKGEEHFLLVARLLVKTVMTSYAQENSRHKPNIEKIHKQLFPAENRADSLSRPRLIALANAITNSTNEFVPVGERQELLDPNASGVLGEAFRRVLAVTTANHATHEQADSHRLQDRMYAELIGMMLEQRQTV